MGTFDWFTEQNNRIFLKGIVQRRKVEYVVNGNYNPNFQVASKMFLKRWKIFPGKSILYYNDWNTGWRLVSSRPIS